MIEKALGIKWQPIVGIPKEEGSVWSQVRVETRVEGEEKVALVVMLSLQDEEDVREKGRVLMETIVGSFQNSKDLGMDFVTREASLLKEDLGGKGEGVLALVIEDGGKRILYVGGVGGMRAEVIRDGKENEIWRGGRVVSGFLKNEDKVVLGSRDFFERVWEKGVESGVLRTKLMAVEEGEGIVGLIVEVEEVGETHEIADILETEGLESLPVEEEMAVGAVGEKGEENEVFAQSRWEKKAGSSWLTRVKRQWGLGNLTLRKPSEGGRKSWGLIAGMIFLLVLGGSVIVGAQKQALSKEREEFLSVMEPIEFALEEAEKIKELNGVRARSLILEAKEEIEKQGDRFEEGGMSEDWEKLKMRVESAWKEVSGEETVSGEMWLDLGVVKDGVVIEGLDINEQLLTWSRDGRVVIATDLGDKSSEIIAGGETLEGVMGMAGIRSGVALLGEGGIRVVDEENKVLAELDLEGVKGKVVEGFGNNVYLLADEDFFRFAAADSGWGKRSRFLRAGVEIGMEEMVDVYIDGEVWLLKASGEVVRLNQGAVVAFELKLVEEFKEPVRVMASEELNRVWVWDRQLGVVEFERESGNYLRKLMWEEFSQMRDIEVDVENKRLIGVKGSEIWVVGL